MSVYTQKENHSVNNHSVNLSMIKILSKLGIKWHFLNLIKDTHKKLTANIVFNGEIFFKTPLKSGSN